MMVYDTRQTAWVAALTVLVMSSLVVGRESHSESASVLAERNHLVALYEREGVRAHPLLVAALNHEQSTVRLTAAHLLAAMGRPALPGIARALDNADPAVRRVAVQTLSAMERLTDYWQPVLLDDDPAIRRLVTTRLLKEHPLPTGEALDRLLAVLMRHYVDAAPGTRVYAVELLSRFDPLPPQARLALIAATLDASAVVREAAYQGVLAHIECGWQAAPQLLARAEADKADAIRGIGQELRWKLLQITDVHLPRQGWRFQLDPEGIGRERGWFEPGLDDAAWRTDVPIESSWQDHVDPSYWGAAWYRREFDVPDVPEWNSAHLHFEGVDEEAWVWLNGQFVGSHAVGPEGWSEPFLLAVDGALKPGERNHIAVLARNTAAGGGIWAPVHLRVLDSTRLEETGE